MNIVGKKKDANFENHDETLRYERNKFEINFKNMISKEVPDNKKLIRVMNRSSETIE